jgi:hypothetical protein
MRCPLLCRLQSAIGPFSLHFSCSNASLSGRPSMAVAVAVLQAELPAKVPAVRQTAGARLLPVGLVRHTRVLASQSRRFSTRRSTARPCKENSTTRAHKEGSRALAGTLAAVIVVTALYPAAREHSNLTCGSCR